MRLSCGPLAELSLHVVKVVFDCPSMSLFEGSSRAPADPVYFISINELSGADIANAASGNVIQSDGDGTLRFGNVSGGSGVQVQNASYIHEADGITSTRRQPSKGI